MVQLEERNELDYNKPAWCVNVDIHYIHYYGILGKLRSLVYHIVIQKDFDILTYMIFITMAY